MVVIYEDLVNSACESDDTEKAFKKYLHHRSLSTPYTVQNVGFFCQGKRSYVITLNTKYMMLFKKSQDKL